MATSSQVSAHRSDYGLLQAARGAHLQARGKRGAISRWRRGWTGEATGASNRQSCLACRALRNSRFRWRSLESGNSE